MIAAVGATFDAIPENGVRLRPKEKQTLLMQICPGKPTAKGCSTCPPETAFSRSPDWDLRSIIFGHFLSRSSNDALVFGDGCEPHAEENGGSFLLTKDGAGWRKLWYAAGEIADHCRKLKGSDGRDRLVCEGRHQSQGVLSNFLYLLDPGQDPRKRGTQTRGDILFSVLDTLYNCQGLRGGLTYAGEIRSVLFVGSDKKRAVKIIAVARLGRAKIPADILNACRMSLNMSKRPVIEGVLQQYRFLFDGLKITPEGRNPADEAPRVSWHMPK